MSDQLFSTGPSKRALDLSTMGDFQMPSAHSIQQPNKFYVNAIVLLQHDQKFQMSEDQQASQADPNSSMIVRKLVGPYTLPEYQLVLVKDIILLKDAPTSTNPEPLTLDDFQVAVEPLILYDYSDRPIQNETLRVRASQLFEYTKDPPLLRESQHSCIALYFARDKRFNGWYQHALLREAAYYNTSMALLAADSSSKSQKCAVVYFKSLSDNTKRGSKHPNYNDHTTVLEIEPVLLQNEQQSRAFSLQGDLREFYTKRFPAIITVRSPKVSTLEKALLYYDQLRWRKQLNLDMQRARRIQHALESGVGASLRSALSTLAKSDELHAGKRTVGDYAGMLTPPTNTITSSYLCRLPHPLLRELAQRYQDDIEWLQTESIPSQQSISSLKQLLCQPLTKINSTEDMRSPVLRLRDRSEAQQPPTVYKSVFYRILEYKRREYSVHYVLKNVTKTLNSAHASAIPPQPGGAPASHRGIHGQSLTEREMTNVLYAPMMDAVRTLAALHTAYRDPNFPPSIHDPRIFLNKEELEADLMRKAQQYMNYDTYLTNNTMDKTAAEGFVGLERDPSLVFWGQTNTITCLDSEAKLSETLYNQPPRPRPLEFHLSHIYDVWRVYAGNPHLMYTHQYSREGAMSVTRRQQGLTSYEQFWNENLIQLGITPEELNSRMVKYYPWDVEPIVVPHTRHYITHQVYNLQNHPRVSVQLSRSLKMAFAHHQMQHYQQMHGQQSLTPITINSIIPKDERPKHILLDAQEEAIRNNQPPPAIRPEPPHTPFIVPLPMYHPIVPMPNLTTLVNIQERAPWILQHTSIPTTTDNEFKNPYSPYERTELPRQRLHQYTFDPASRAKKVSYIRK